MYFKRKAYDELLEWKEKYADVNGENFSMIDQFKKTLLKIDSDFLNL